MVMKKASPRSRLKWRTSVLSSRRLYLDPLHPVSFRAPRSASARRQRDREEPTLRRILPLPYLPNHGVCSHTLAAARLTHTIQPDRLCNLILEPTCSDT